MRQEILRSKEEMKAGQRKKCLNKAFQVDSSLWKVVERMDVEVKRLKQEYGCQQHLTLIKLYIIIMVIMVWY